MTSKVEICLMR